MSILELLEVKNALKITTSEYDTELAAVLAGVEEGVNVMCGFSESTAFTEKRQSVNGHIIVRQRPILSITSVTGQRYGALTVGNLFFADETSIIRPTYGSPYIADDWYTVVYNAGRAAVPAAIKHGTQVIVQHQWQVRRGPSARPGADVSEVPGVGYAVPTRAIQIFRDANFMRGPLVG